MIPLLKHELWSSIQAENRNRNRFEVKINTMDLVKRAERKRYVFHLQSKITLKQMSIFPKLILSAFLLCFSCG